MHKAIQIVLLCVLKIVSLKEFTCTPLFVFCLHKGGVFMLEASWPKRVPGRKSNLIQITPQQILISTPSIVPVIILASGPAALPRGTDDVRDMISQ